MTEAVFEKQCCDDRNDVRRDRFTRDGIRRGGVEKDAVGMVEIALGETVL